MIEALRQAWEGARTERLAKLAATLAVLLLAFWLNSDPQHKNLLKKPLKTMILLYGV